jgi:hypothetical protein
MAADRRQDVGKADELHAGIERECDPAATLAIVEPGLAPAEAAQARAAIAALPSAQQHVAAMVPVYAEIDATVRNGEPEEAAAARQQLAALQRPRAAVAA